MIFLIPYCKHLACIFQKCKLILVITQYAFLFFSTSRILVVLEMRIYGIPLRSISQIPTNFLHICWIPNFLNFMTLGYHPGLGFFRSFRTLILSQALQTSNSKYEKDFFFSVFFFISVVVELKNAYIPFS